MISKNENVLFSNFWNKVNYSFLFSCISFILIISTVFHHIRTFKKIYNYEYLSHFLMLTRIETHIKRRYG